MNDIKATATDEEVTAADEEPIESQPHPAWCDLDECTMRDKDGAHHSTWMTLGPLPLTGFVARAYLYQTGDKSAPIAMVSLHFPVEHPDDIAENAGCEEDTTGFVLPLDHVDQLNAFFTLILTLNRGVATLEGITSSPR